MCFAGSLARFGGYRCSTSLSTPRAPGWVTFFATAARPRNIHLDRALGGCQHERNINGRAGRGPVSIFRTNRRESLHQQQSPAPRALLLTRQVRSNSGPPTRHTGGSLSLSMFPIADAKFACDFSARIFLLVPKLHHNAAVPKSGFCNLLSENDLVGGRGFEPRASCAQGKL